MKLGRKDGDLSSVFRQEGKTSENNDLSRESHWITIELLDAW